MNVHFSSQTDLWATPQDFFNKLNEEFNFELDVCARHENAKCKKYFTKEQDGLVQEWKGVCWMNPPYGREIGKWMQKAYEAAQGGGQQSFVLFLQEPIRGGGMNMQSNTKSDLSVAVLSLTMQKEMRRFLPLLW